MDELLSRVWNQLLERTAGPFHFRFILQPLAASALAIRAGLNDAKTHQAPYLWHMLSVPSERSALIRSGWKDIGKVLTMALVLDGIYQLIMFRWFYPVEALIVAFVLGIFPYALIRGPVARIARRHAGGGQTS
jgi:hypothetical protein